MSPVVYVLAGPNGTGKTTFYNIAIEQGMISPALPFLNIDNICRGLPGGYTEENYVRAAELYRQEVSGYLKAKASFMIESNLAKETDYDWLWAMEKASYRLTLYFLCTDRVEINIERVQLRVAEGGHSVEEAIVRQRYENGLSLLRRYLHRVDNVLLVDCSGNRSYLNVG